ncbi:surface protease GP63 [Trypanosoma cruzi]|nr:surface protease GP63 [Trypanosoma cruzi]
MPRCPRVSTTTATTLMAWSCRMTMGTGGRWSRTGRSATRGMSGWHRLGCRLLRRKCSALNMSEYRHMLCEAGVSARRCASDRYSSGCCVDGVSMKCQQNARWTVAPSLTPHWM